LKELEWDRFGAPEIEVVITRPVQAELDEQKKAPGRVGRRAREANTLLRALLNRLVHDQMVDGRALKMLCVIDEYTRECLAIEVGASLRAGSSPIPSP
jgi:predicted ribonuclease YlaK